MDFSGPQKPTKPKPVEEAPKPQVSPADAGETKPTEQLFLECFERLVSNVYQSSDLKDSALLLDFIIKFKSIFNKNYFADEMGSTLMRQLYLESEEADHSLLEGVSAVRGKKHQQETEVVRRLADHEIYA